MGAQGLDTRQRLLQAAHLLMRERGLVGCTTKEIARAAGVSEGTIYNHFQDKYDLCLAVLEERLPLASMLDALPEQAGERPVRDVLVEIVETAIEVYAETIPMFSGVIGHPELAELHRKREEGRAPASLLERLAAYLAAEQRAGGMGEHADPRLCARMLLGTGFHDAYLGLVLGGLGPGPSGRALAEGVVDTVLAAASRFSPEPAHPSP